MEPGPLQAPDDRVSRRRYERERMARSEAERLLEDKSRELWDLNVTLREQASRLEEAVRRRTADLEEAKRQAEHASAAKSSFLAMISHDIRTPLNGVLGMAQVLRETGMTEGQSTMIDLIMSSGETLMGLLNDVLDLSKIEALQMEVEEIPVDFPALVNDIGRLFMHTAQEKGLLLQIDVARTLPQRILSDPTRLRQILANLVSNALKFTETGSVRLSAGVNGGEVWFEVHDTGQGVAEDRRHNLFKAFSQTDVSVARRYGGTGLGLTISRELCRLMGGDLVYAPSPDGGACFRGTLKASLAVETAVQGPDPRSKEGARAILAGRPWRVLAAEDNVTNQTVLRHMLRPLVPDLTIVADGDDALDAFCAGDFDIVLMDINMPRMNGTEAATAMRATEAARGLNRTPIVALTANVMTHQVASYLPEGFDAHVPKPIRRDDLVECMARLLVQSQRQTHAA